MITNKDEIIEIFDTIVVVTKTEGDDFNTLFSKKNIDVFNGKIVHGLSKSVITENKTRCQSAEKIVDSYYRADMEAVVVKKIFAKKNLTKDSIDLLKEAFQVEIESFEEIYIEWAKLVKRVGYEVTFIYPSYSVVVDFYPGINNIFHLLK
ncbi:hypothetical protein LE191_07320 [Janthinobacterium sp. HSC-3S05]|uniref:hypothetical protein n=1 Tax=Janthinobacterium lividum TaxID=29581 RepID=UPI001CD89AA1|nr:hypothetical protein [Janthinobacterium lividum]MCA1859922.1 hypothetical protein [Janthinobacterium lividum]